MAQIHMICQNKKETIHNKKLFVFIYSNWQWSSEEAKKAKKQDGGQSDLIFFI